MQNLKLILALKETILVTRHLHGLLTVLSQISVKINYRYSVVSWKIVAKTACSFGSPKVEVKLQVFVLLVLNRRLI